MQRSSIVWKTFDGVNLALGLSSLISDKLAAVAHEVKNESKLSNHRLADAVSLLAQEVFPSSRLAVAHLKQLTKRLKLVTRKRSGSYGCIGKTWHGEKG